MGSRDFKRTVARDLTRQKTQSENPYNRSLVGVTNEKPVVNLLLSGVSGHLLLFVGKAIRYLTLKGHIWVLHRDTETCDPARLPSQVAGQGDL
jgi:hypothetical protein